MKRTPSRLPATLQKIAKTKGQACRPEWTFGSREWNESRYKNSGTPGTPSVCPHRGLGDSSAQRRVGHRFHRGEKGPGVGKGPLFLFPWPPSKDPGVFTARAGAALGG